MGRDRTIPLHADWEQVKDRVMRKAVLQKFSTHPDIRAILLATGEDAIVENAPFNFYWGCDKDRTGKNRLEKILMDVRAILRS